MAPSFFFFTLLLLLSTQIQARDSYFFGKFRRDNVAPVETTDKTSREETTNPIPQNDQPQDQNPTFIPDSNNGYGLYGHDTETTTYNNKHDQNFNSKTFSTPSLTETEEDSSTYNNKYDQNFNSKTEQDSTYNNKYDDKFNTKTFSTPSLTETEEESTYNNKYDEKYPKERTESYQNYNSYNNNKYENTNGYENNNEKDLYKSNAYGEALEGERGYKGYTSHNLEREGMSDTRFMEKGKYYYDVYNARNHGHFYQKTRPTTTYNPAGFKDPYDSKWEQEQEQVPEEFQEEQVGRFNP